MLDDAADFESPAMVPVSTNLTRLTCRDLLPACRNMTGAAFLGLTGRLTTLGDGGRPPKNILCVGSSVSSNVLRIIGAE